MGKGGAPYIHAKVTRARPTRHVGNVVLSRSTGEGRGLVVPGGFNYDRDSIFSAVANVVNAGKTRVTHDDLGVSSMEPTNPSAAPEHDATTPSILQQLMDEIERRRDQPPSPEKESYTVKLLSSGLPKIGKKVLEEAQELIEAAGPNDAEGRQHTVYEAADLLYHVFVLLAHRRVRLDEVEQELARRFGVSGVAEKAARTQKGVGAWATAKAASADHEEPAD